MLSKDFCFNNVMYRLKKIVVITVISVCILIQYIHFSNAGDVIRDIHIRGIATNNQNVLLAIIEDPASGNIKAYQLHDKLKDFEIVDIKKKEGILLKKGEKKIWILLSKKNSFWNKNKIEDEVKEPQFYTFLKNEIDTDNITIKSKTVVDKKDHEPVGVTVTEINEGSFLRIMGIESGDVLIEINGYQISQPKDLEEAIEKLINADISDAANNGIRIAFERGGMYQTSYGEVQ
jgi:hypothetical protein